MGERMPVQHEIRINRNPQGAPRVKFDPDPLRGSRQDQIFWINNDSDAHWPGLLTPDGSINVTFFMRNEIAPNGVSPVFSSTDAGTLNYACSLHRDETGTIKLNGGSRDYPP